MREINVKTLARVERCNLKNTDFISYAVKLYIKYRELKVKLTNGIRISDIRHLIRHPLNKAIKHNKML